MRALMLVIVGGLALLLGPALSLSQDGPGGSRKSGGKGSKGGSDSGSKKGKGKGGPGRSSAGDPWGNPGSFNNPNAEAVPTAGDGRFGGGIQNSLPPAGFGGMTGSTPGGRGGRGERDLDAAAQYWFQRLDQNGDGVLSFEEMGEALQAEHREWDTNGDGFLDWNEFRNYFRARAEQWQAERGLTTDPAMPGGSDAGRGPGRPAAPAAITNGARAPTLPARDEPARPVTYRPGNLPRELPPWFAERDHDRDGQIGLYEWRRSGGSLEEFQRLDANNDGFVTVEEVLRAQKAEGQRAETRPGGGAAGTGPGMAGGPRDGTDGERQPSFGGTGRGGRGGRGGRSPSNGA